MTEEEKKPFSWWWTDEAPGTQFSFPWGKTVVPIPPIEIQVAQWRSIFSQMPKPGITIDEIMSEPSYAWIAHNLHPWNTEYIESDQLLLPGVE